MRRIVVTLIISVIIFAATISVSIMSISRKSLETADYINNIALDHFQTKLNSDIQLMVLLARNFLAGIPSMSVEKDSVGIIVEKDMLPVVKKEIREVLPQLMRINKYYKNSMFVIDREICRKYFKYDASADSWHCQKGFVPYIQQGDDTIYDLSDKLDFMNSADYLRIKENRKILWTTVQPLSPTETGLLMLNVPMSLSDGQFFGVFAVSLDIKTVNAELRRNLPYGEEQSAIFIVDENNKIFSACPDWIIEQDCQNIILESTNTQKGNIGGAEHDIHEFAGKEYYVYQRELRLLPWRIYTVNQTEAIYHEANHVTRAIVFSSLIGMLLMLVCCIVVFRQTRKNLRIKAAVEEELRMAAMVQTSMLKPANCTISNITLNALMRPAKDVGGDLYDYVEKDGKMVFCIGDVSGKGMSAALFMAQVVSLFRNAVRYSCEAAEIVSRINDVLAGNNKMTFCTFFVGILSGDELSFCNAGHNPPVLITSHASYLDVRPNLAMGLREGYPYQSETISLEPGDKLVLYTDGVTEARNGERELFGDKRLLDVLASMSVDRDTAITARLMESIEQFEQQAEQSDDITIVSIVVSKC